MEVAEDLLALPAILTAWLETLNRADFAVDDGALGVAPASRPAIAGRARAEAAQTGTLQG